MSTTQFCNLRNDCVEWVPNTLVLTFTSRLHLFINTKRSMAPKRSHGEMSGKPADTGAASSPFMPMFETFRAELDEHHDRRERTIKASRDVTAASKKM